MRIIYIAIASLGLFLVVFSRQESAHIQRYCAVVAQTKTTAIRMYSDEKLRNHSYMTSPSMESALSDLDSAVELQRGWRIICWIGAIAGIAGLGGLAYQEWRRQRQVTESVHEREPFRVKLGL